MVDAILTLRSAAATITTDTQGAALRISELGSPIRKPLWARCPYYNAVVTSGNILLMARVMHRDDTGNWRVLANDPEGPIALDTTAKSGLIEIPIVDSKEEIRLDFVFQASEIAGGAVGQTVTVGAAHLVPFKS